MDTEERSAGAISFRNVLALLQLRYRLLWAAVRSRNRRIALLLAAPAGSFFGFLGPNGAGKSTTIGCLTGLLDFAGGIRLLGEPMHSDAVALKRRIGVMPESLGLFDGLYAHEFLAFQARIYGLDERTTRDRVTELLEALELGDEGRKPLLDFSAGMRKRVAFAAAIIHTPDLLFLDEPFESIDPTGVSMMKDWLRRIVAQGRTVFMTTHVLETVERLCDRIAIITSPGKLVWEGAIAPLANGGLLVVNGHEFHSLEALFIQLSGRRSSSLDWL